MKQRKAKTQYDARYWEDCKLEIFWQDPGLRCNMKGWFYNRSLGLSKERSVRHMYAGCFEDCPKPCNMFLKYTGTACAESGCRSQTPCTSCQDKIRKDALLKRLVLAVSEDKPELRFEENCDYRHAGFMWWR